MLRCRTARELARRLGTGLHTRSNAQLALLSSLAAMCVTEGSTHAVWGELAISTLHKLNFPEADPGEASSQRLGWCLKCCLLGGCWCCLVLRMWQEWSRAACRGCRAPCQQHQNIRRRCCAASCQPAGGAHPAGRCCLTAVMVDTWVQAFILSDLAPWLPAQQRSM